MEQTHSPDQQEPQAVVETSVRPSISSLLPASSEPETHAQRLGERRNGAYHEKVSVRAVDPRAEEERRRMFITTALEVTLAMFLSLAITLWNWAREERTRARVDRDLRHRIPAT